MAPSDNSPAHHPPRVERAAALKSILGLWLIYFILNTAHMAMGGHSGQIEMMGRRLAVSVIGAGITFLLYLMLRSLEERPLPVMVTAAVLASIPASIAYAAANFAAFYLVAPADSLLQELSMMQAKHQGIPTEILEGALSWYFFIVAWCVFYIALSYAARVGQAERAAAAYRSEAQSAQLRALRYQINPHFLFNTLNALSTLVLKQRTAEADAMISNLATFFRSSLTSDPGADVTLADEIRMQRLYLDIEKVRFPDRLKLAIAVPDDLQDALVPGMILQPLVENAIRHGVARSTGTVTLAIRASSRDGVLTLVVEDDAAGATPVAGGSGLGLKNVGDRLAIRFGAGASAVYGPLRDGGFQVSLSMPLKFHD